MSRRTHSLMRLHCCHGPVTASPCHHVLPQLMRWTDCTNSMQLLVLSCTSTIHIACRGHTVYIHVHTNTLPFRDILHDENIRI
jgi:hypothetical protein